MMTMTNMLVLSILCSPVPTTVARDPKIAYQVQFPAGDLEVAFYAQKK